MAAPGMNGISRIKSGWSVFPMKQRHKKAPATWRRMLHNRHEKLRYRAARWNEAQSAFLRATGYFAQMTKRYPPQQFDQWEIRMRVAIVALAVAGHMACVPGPAIAKEPSDVEARHARAFITAFQVWSDKAQVQHGALAVLHEGQLVDAVGIGGRRPDEPAAIASLSKAITGLCVSRLVDAGRLRYDEPIGEVLADYFARAGRPIDRRMEAVTVSQLLTHRSGIVRKVDGPDSAADISPGMRSPLEEKVRRVLKEPLEFAPGSSFSYSNSGYIVLSLIVEQVSSRSYETQCKESVLLPVGATSAHIASSVAALGRSGAGGWEVSASDYARFLVQLDTQSPAMSALTRRWIAARNKDTPSYGLGFRVTSLPNGQRVIEHNGLLDAPDTSASAQYLVLPGSWIVVANVSPARPKLIGELTAQFKNIGGSEASSARSFAEPHHAQHSQYPPQIPQELEYRGYKIDLSKVATRDDASAIVRSIQKQVDLVEALQIRSSIKEFFRSIPISLEPDLHGEGRYSSNGGLQMIAKVDADDRPILLHELLHALHFDKLPNGRQNSDIMIFYERAKGIGSYPKDAYMLKNAAEFFAMTASAYLHGSVARPPYSREALMRAQPIYAQYLGRLFGSEPAPASVSGSSELH
jgi:CubicO group peptidase (beta-lactamase class C family)